MSLALVLALLVTQNPDCHTVKVCKVHKTAVKKVQVHKVVKHFVRPVQIESECCGHPQEQQQQQSQHQQVIIITGNNGANVSSTATATVINVAPTYDNLPWFGLGLVGAVGFWGCDPYVFGLLGLRARFFPAHLGLGADTQFYWGNDIKLMVYPIQGPIAWHLDAGGMWFYHLPFTNQDVSRKWDMLLGTGLEFEVLPHLSVTADWRFTTINPFDLNRMAYPDATGRWVNPGNVVGNAFLRSQFMFGLMLSTW